MINFIKDAVNAVSGIKSFLFNTDYRNNFDLQNVEFPCCVLTPIMSKKYDLNNIIRESAELQLSVVDLAPYEYTGDDLYAINKRCSDLALQVIANLQVKSKLDKELTFEFILPSGDELISGIMANLNITMKQGKCAPQPNILLRGMEQQPIGVSILATNGTFYLPSEWKNLDAMHHDKIVGVAVSDGEHKFLFNTTFGDLPWGGDNVLIENIVTTTNQSVAITDFDGENNTIKISEQLKGYVSESGIKNAPACDKSLNYTFKNGKKGYLMSAGELQIMVNYRDDIEDAYKAICRNYFYAYISTSTQYDKSNYWYYRWGLKQWGVRAKKSKNNNYVLPICKL